MASIVGSSSYGEGHKVVLKDKSQIKNGGFLGLLLAYNYAPGITVFTITKSKTKPDIVLQIGTGTDKIFLKDPKNKVVAFLGTATAINNVFNHFSANAKSDTRVLTEVKETISMIMFRSAIENNTYLTEDQLIQKLSAGHKSKYDRTYYDSALKQTKELKKYIKTGGYQYERQADYITKQLYEVARRLSGKANDNWNPADVWLIADGYNIGELYKNAQSIAQVNEGIARAYKKKLLYPISLKQVTTANAKYSVVDPASMMNKPLEYDLSFEKVDLSDSFNNFILQTKSGFAVRAGFKASATTLNVSLEGRFVGAGYQLGAIEASTFPGHIQSTYGYTVRSSKEIGKNDYATAKKELKAIFDKYSRISNTITSYKQAIDLFEHGDKLTKDRFANLISYLYAFLIAPGSTAKFKDLMTYCYYSSKKIVNDASMYVIIQNA